tara:strand:+ start:66 stop:332 length:267 start_codon:yes stop_codon:yes gene_type:complete
VIGGNWLAFLDPSPSFTASRKYLMGGVYGRLSTTSPPLALAFCNASVVGLIAELQGALNGFSEDRVISNQLDALRQAVALRPDLTPPI